ncbi:MAG: hypothetical protein PHV37_02320 [Candidatus Gastranaerophilales bacterium]|nr:hypothetical protein [Candidatus Gastranaerophilales bacterium]
MKKILAVLLLATIISTTTTAAFAGTHGKDGKITGKSVGAGALSLLIWPGIGQAVNAQQDDKILTHALLGLTGVFRFWSCYDAVVDRNGGVWHNRI